MQIMSIVYTVLMLYHVKHSLYDIVYSRVVHIELVT